MIIGIMGAMPDEVDQLCAKLENVTVEPYGGVVYRWYRAGITQGDQNGNFNGSSHITRAETAAILCRLAGLAERV